jgi:hypothetical protein
MSSSALDDPQRLYPGHSKPELLVFQKDHDTNDIVHKPLESDLNARHSAVTISNDEALRAADEPPLAGSLRIFRFVARVPIEDQQASTRLSEVDTLVCLFDKLRFPITSIVAARKTPRIELLRLFGYPGDSDEHPVFSIAGSRLCLVWTCDIPARSTTAVLVNFLPSMRNFKFDFPHVLGALLRSFAGCFEHPMLLALALAQCEQAVGGSVFWSYNGNGENQQI